jgi:PKD repeat protein
MTKKYLIYSFLLLCNFTEVFSQLSEPGIPESFNIKTKSAVIIPIKNLEAIDTSRMLADDRKNSIPNRYGVIELFEADIKKEGVETVIPDKGTIWQYQLYSPNAYSLGIQFEKYHLPKGAKVFVYNENHKQVAGAFTKLDNNQSNSLNLAEFKGNTAIVEYFEPIDPEFEGELTIGSVSKAYRDLFSDAQSPIGINCPQGADWQLQKHAVCMMTYHDTIYSYQCSGSLINTVKSDGTPYYLTANHCINSNRFASTLVLYFNYEDSACTNTLIHTQTLSGSTLVSGNSYSDFSLLLITQTPPASYSPYYAGWDASSRQPENGTCISHPSGKPKSIAIANNPPINYNQSIPWNEGKPSSPYTHWEVQFNEGVIEEGSSGSPLFDDNKRIVGQLHGGSTDTAYFGKFSVSWNHSSSKNQQLKAWLDPDTTDTLTNNGHNLAKPQADFSIPFNHVCLSTPIKIIDLSINDPTKWTWTIEPSSYSFVDSTNEHSQFPEVVFQESGSYTISLIASNANGSDSLTKNNYIIASNTLNVNFSGFPADTTICGYDLVNFPLVPSGASLYNYKIEPSNKIIWTIKSDTLFLSLVQSEKKNGNFDSWVNVIGTQGSCIAADSIKLEVVLPVNDDIENAAELHLGSNMPYSNQCATVENNEPYYVYQCPIGESCPKILNHTIWFTFRGPSSGWVTIDSYGFEDRLSVFEASSYDSILSGNSSLYTILAASDDNSSTGDGADIDNLKVSQGKTYWLQVDGYMGATGDCVIDLLSNSVEILPNPNNGKFNIIISSLNDGNAEIQIYSSLGILQLAKQVAVSKESNTFSFDLSTFPSALYYIVVGINNNVIKRKLLIAK